MKNENLIQIKPTKKIKKIIYIKYDLRFTYVQKKWIFRKTFWKFRNFGTWKKYIYLKKNVNNITWIK